MSVFKLVRRLECAWCGNRQVLEVQEQDKDVGWFWEKAAGRCVFVHEYTDELAQCWTFNIDGEKQVGVVAWSGLLVIEPKES